MNTSDNDTNKRILNCLLGMMAGDSIGLPYEGISRKRQPRLLPPPLRHRLFFGRGMISDDTEHALMTAASLAQYWYEPNKFENNLLWRLRWWFLRLPAGMGMATGKALIKAWLGFPASKCGVFSAGNGPAMRAPILGVCLGHEPNKMKDYVSLSTKLTHTDPKALIGALAVAQAAYMASNASHVSFDEYKSAVQSLYHDLDSKAVNEFNDLLEKLGNSLHEDEFYFAKLLKLENGITGYMYHTVPMVLFIWLKYQGDFKSSIEKIITCGGDTDTTAAILGGICAPQNNSADIPAEWLNNIIEYPFNKAYCKKMATRLNTCLQGQVPEKTPTLLGPLILIRNLLFLLIVLFHGFRRLAPPY